MINRMILNNLRFTDDIDLIADTKPTTANG